MGVKTNEVTCPRCGTSHTKKNGTTPQGKQRYRCKKCGKQFLFCLNYTYHAWNPLYRKLIVPMTLNGSGVRDIARVLHISPTTVLAVLRQAAAQTPEPRVPPRILALEMDEQWSFVQSKKQQYWLWYGLNRHTGHIPAFVLGRRTNASCHKLCRKLAPCQVRHFYTDDWQSYAKSLDAKRHSIGKDGTQNIERKNLNFRTHLKRMQRRTICFSKEPEMHEAVLKLYIHALNSKQHHF
jgi:IS1 family transposase/transposase-like protein